MQLHERIFRRLLRDTDDAGCECGGGISVDDFHKNGLPLATVITSSLKYLEVLIRSVNKLGIF